MSKQSSKRKSKQSSSKKKKSKLIEIEEIRGKQGDNGKVYYLIKEKDEDESENGWYLEENIIDKDMITEYESKQTDLNKKWKWQYYLETDMNGRLKGWHDVDTVNSDFMEQEYKSMKPSTCIITPKFNYAIDLVDLVQTNTKTNTKRMLRRV